MALPPSQGRAEDVSELVQMQEEFVQEIIEGLAFVHFKSLPY